MSTATIPATEGIKNLNKSMVVTWSTTGNEAEGFTFKVYGVEYQKPNAILMIGRRTTRAQATGAAKKGKMWFKAQQKKLA